MTAPGPNDNLPSKSGGAAAPSKGGGFFSVYKKGQGYWTRLCTALTAALILLVTANFIYQQARPPLTATFQKTHGDAFGRNLALAIAASVVIVFGALVWKVMNSPKGGDFLITTDSEMKRVNWASRKEVFGSTRVVVIFLAFVCTFLFLADILFAWFFHLIGVLKFGPFAS